MVILQVAVLIVLHQTLTHLFNVLKYQCFMEASQTFLFLPSLTIGETEAWESRSVEQVRGRFESRSRLHASCLPGAGFPQNPAAISIPGEHFSLVQCFQAQSLSCIIVALCSSPGMQRLFGGEPFTGDFCCEWTSSDLQPAERKLPTWVSAPTLLCVIREAVVKVEKKGGGRKYGGVGLTEGRRRGQKTKEGEKRVKAEEGGGEALLSRDRGAPGFVLRDPPPAALREILP